MTDGDENTQTLIPVHVGLREPVAAPPPVLGSGGGFSMPPHDIPLLQPDFDWAAQGLIPRWIGMESGDCPAAIEPNIFHQRGGDELKRFLAGAASRGEIAVLVATVGNVNDDQPRGVLARRGGSTLLLADTEQAISGVRAPERTTISLAPGVEGPERDLGLRLKRRPPDAPWWSLSLHGMTTAAAYGPSEQTRTTGMLQPILLDALGQPVAAVWISEAADQRWYLVPDQADWDSILGWLTTQAIPEFVPAALRRLRSPLLRDPELMTVAESAAEDGLHVLDQEFERRRAALREALEEARAQADPIRDGLLYGTGKHLEQTVDAVLRDAGIAVVDLDSALNDTSSADLLTELDGRRRLIEVKSSSGNAPESLMARLENHLRNWQAPGRDEVEGGVLIVNHQHRRPPSARSASVYDRSEFLRNLTAPVISTMQLFDWWRLGEWASIRDAVFPSPTAPGATSTANAAQPGPSESAETRQRRRWPRGS